MRDTIGEKQSPRQLVGSAWIFLLVTILAVGGLLTLLSRAVGPELSQRQETEKNRQMAAVVPGANVFSQVYFEDPLVDDVLGAYDETTLKGYCVRCTVSGFAGPMELLVGVSPAGEVTGVLVLRQNEMEDMGALAAEEPFLRQYLGRSGTIRVERGSNAVDTVSGATTTCKAVTQGVNRALAAVANLKPEEGIGDENGAV